MSAGSSEDPSDRLDREAHGFFYDDDFQDLNMVCRNGCGLSYMDVVSGKIRRCTAVSAVDQIREEAVAELLCTGRAQLLLADGSVVRIEY